MQVFEQLTYIHNASLVLGFFDGLHSGHMAAIKNAVSIAEKNNTQSAVILFRTHPLRFLSKNPPELILTLDEKLEMFEKTGIDNAVILDFENYAAMKAADYLENVLVKYFSPAAITTGFNHCFGFNKEGNSLFLRQNQEKYGYKYYEIPPYRINGMLVSCTAVRNMLKSGNFFDASKLLGYYFFLRGQVIHGDKIASKLGFPSANIIYPDNKVKIPFGVYYTRVKTCGKEYKGVLNYGAAPSINNEQKIKTEVHILDFNRDIYGETIQISLIAKIRNQIKFENTEKLKDRLRRDADFAQNYP